ncbi:hypothetical protein [Streptomyces sp. NPDC058683]|uniref:hypothetical protein n=1 Tax=Streptomyces sp. NPDC058683 TaxID=3346597 RepID=UPI00364AF26F
MSRPLDGHVTGSLSHRTGYGPVGDNMVEFRYQLSGETTLIRPDDGQAAGVVRMRCPACDKALTYRVYSIRTTRRRQALWWALTAFAVALIIGGVVLATTLPDEGVSDVMVHMVVWSVIGGFVAGVVLIQLAWGEFGVRGHRTGWPIMAKHRFELAPSDDDKPALHCDRCGHREVMESDGYDAYSAAKARLRQHTCI